MLKRILCLLSALVLILGFAACGNEDADGNAFPLDTKTVEAVTKEYDSSFTVKLNIDEENRVKHDIYAEDKYGVPQQVIGMITGTKNGEKTLSMTFVSGSGLPVSVTDEFNTSVAVTPETVEDTLVYAAKLYGLEADSIYDAFKEEYRKENTTTTETNEYNRSHEWKSEIDGVTVRVRFNEYYGIDRTVLSLVDVVSDWDTFH